MSTCRSCHAEIVWTFTAASGKRMPLDPIPTPGGNVIIDAQGCSVVLSITDTATPGPRFTPHWATCPTADQHRTHAERTPR